MEYLSVLEFIGMIFSMLGALFMSLNGEKYKRHLLFAFVFFTIANVAMLQVATEKGLIPLLIQLILFTITGYLGIKSQIINTKHEAYIIYLKLLIIVSFGVATYNLLGDKQFVFHTTLMEVVAASMAIIGSYILKSHDLNIRINAFGLFFAADILYVFVGLENSLYFFTAQSFFFTFTSIMGYVNTKRIIQRDLKTI